MRNGHALSPITAPGAPPDAEAAFPGAKVIDADKPLFCVRCDPLLIATYTRLWDQGAPVAELVEVLEQRRGTITRRTWPDGRQEWACCRCGRAAYCGLMVRDCE